METPYEYYNSKLGVKVKYLTTDLNSHSDSLILMGYRALKKRMDSNTSSERQLRKGSWSYDSLVEFDSLCMDWRQLIHTTFGKPQEKVKKSYFSKYFITDPKAKVFFDCHRYGEDNLKKLRPEVIELYINNASVLNAVLEVKVNRKDYCRTLGGVKLNIWESLSNDVNAFTDVEHNLPTTPGSLRHKVNRFQKEGYTAVISRKYNNINAAKVYSKQQKALVEELFNKHQNLNDQQIADIYNITAKAVGWKTIDSKTIANHRKKMNLFTYAGRRGETNFMHNMEMQVKRKKPSLPMVYWTADGWDAELLYQKRTKNSKGHEVTTYHNRLTAVVILDPFNNYPIGYAIGTHENPALIKEAYRNAFNHTKELFGKRYKPYQLQTDNYQIKNLTPLYQNITKHHTPAKVKNSKAKVIEPYFDKLNEKHFQAKLVPNWSGHNVNASKENQPNADYLNKIRHQFPDETGCRMQIARAIEAERNEKREAYISQWVNLPKEDRIEFTTADFLREFGEDTGYTNRLTGNGVTPTINGQTLAFDSFDINFRKHAHRDWLIKYNPEDLSEVLAINAKSKDGRLEHQIGTFEFLLIAKAIAPMAFYDRAPGDGKKLQEVKDFNKSLRNAVMDRNSERHDELIDLFNENPQLDTLQKLIIPDSRGQHKDQKSIERGAMSPKPNTKQLQPEPMAFEEYEIVDDVRDDY